MSAAGKFDTSRLARIDSFIKERYLDSGGIRRGLLMNFNVRLLKDGLKRFVI